MRSATAPETIVAAVAANIVWKKKKVQSQIPSPPEREGMPAPPQPKTPPSLLAPNMIPAPRM